MAFSGRNIGGGDYSILDAYQFSQQYDRLIERAGTNARKYKLERIENEYLEGGITKGGWYERRIVELQKMLDEETDGFQSLKIQNDILKLMDAKASWNETQANRAESQAKAFEAYQKSQRRDAFLVKKEEAAAEDVEFAQALYNVGTLPTAEAQAVARYSLLHDYRNLLGERLNEPALIPYAGDALKTVEDYTNPIIRKIAILSGTDTTEESFSVGEGAFSPSIQRGELEELRKRVSHIKGVSIAESGVLDTTGLADDQMYETDGTYLPVRDENGLRLVPEEDVDETFIAGPSQDGMSTTYYPLQKETFRTRNEKGEVEREEEVDEYVNTISPGGIPVRVRKKDGQWDWEHVATQPNGVDEEALGIWALGYNSKDEMPSYKLETEDGKQDVRAFSDEQIVGMGRETLQNFQGQSAFDGLYLRDKFSNDLFVIEGGRKRKLEDVPDDGLGDRPNFMVDDQGILDSFADAPMDIAEAYLPEFQPNPDVVPEQFTDNLGRIRKEDGGFEFIEFSGSQRRSIPVEEYAERKGISVEDALQGSENSGDILRTGGEFSQFFEPSPSGRGVSPRQTISQAPPQDSRIGLPRSRGFFGSVFSGVQKFLGI